MVVKTVHRIVEGCVFMAMNIISGYKVGHQPCNHAQVDLMAVHTIATDLTYYLAL